MLLTQRDIFINKCDIFVANAQMRYDINPRADRHISYTNVYIAPTGISQIRLWIYIATIIYRYTINYCLFPLHQIQLFTAEGEGFDFVVCQVGIDFFAENLHFHL